MPAVAPGSLVLLLFFTLLSRGSAERTVLNKIFTERSRHKHGDGSHSSELKSVEGNDIANALSVGSGTLGTTPDALSNPPGTRDSGLGVETMTDASTVKSELAEAKKEAKEQGMHISDGPLSTLQQDTARADLAKQGRASGLDEKMEILAAQSEAGVAGQESDPATERTLPLSEELERSSAAAGLTGGAGGGAGASSSSSKNAAGGKSKKKKSSDNKSIFGPTVTGIDDDESEEADLYAVSEDLSDLDTKDSRTKHQSASKYELPLTSNSKADTKAERKAKSQAGGMHEMSQTTTSSGTKRKPVGGMHEMSQTSTSRSKASASDLPANQRERS
eukprot:jgi/Astpho2/3248/Aster-05769